MRQDIWANHSNETYGAKRFFAYAALAVFGIAVFALLVALTPLSPTQAKIESSRFESAMALRGKVVKTSGSTTCATTSQGALWCWGSNSFGQLGNGSTTLSYTPVLASQMPALVDDFAVSVAHTCVISNGDVWCVGQNTYGQLGNGTSTNSITPTRVSSLPFPAVQISATWNLTCALLTDQSVWCWGIVPYGLGSSLELSPIKINYFSPARQVSVVAYRYCIVYVAGNVECVGVNSNGEVFGAQSITNALQTAQGYDFVCALTSVNAVKCWGANDMGQLGDGTTTPSSHPVNVIGLDSGVQSIYASWHSACALLTDKTLKCWGYKAVQDPAVLWKPDFYPVPTPLTLSTYSLTSFSPFCATDASGAINCLGYLRGEDNFSAVPTNTIGLQSGVVDLTIGEDPQSGGGSIACARTGQTAKCWGKNVYGQVGDGSGRDQSIPTPIISDTAKGVYAGNSHACAVLQDNSVQCWGRDFTGTYPVITSPLPITVGGFNGIIVKMALGSSHGCALYTNSAVNCWGGGSSGQLGNGLSGGGVSSSVPITPVGLESGVMDIASAQTHTCAVLSDHSVKCWGANYYGALGLGGVTSSPTPTLVSGITNAVQIASTFWHTCVTLSNGGAKCWGYNEDGQLGDGSLTTKNTPVDVVGLSANVAQISAGRSHTCALLANGGVQCWGTNGSGELGDGTVDMSLIPVTVIGVPEGFTKIETGNFLSCGITQLGAVKCWGRRNSGQLGNGQYDDYVSVPTPVIGFGKSFEFFLPNTIKGISVSY